MQKNILYVLYLAVITIVLYGCKSGDPASLDINKTNREIEFNEKITKVDLSKSHGASEIIFTDDADIEAFKLIISIAVKEKGIVNMMDADIYLDVFDEKGTLMKTDDTQTIYTVSEEMTDRLIKLIE